MSAAEGLKLAEYLLGNADLARDVVAGANMAVFADISKYGDTKSKRNRAKDTAAKRPKHKEVKQRATEWLMGRFLDKDSFKPTKRGWTTAHYGTKAQLLQKHILRFSNLVAWTHEARSLGLTSGECFREAEKLRNKYEVVAECALARPPSPLSDSLLLRRYVAALLYGCSWPSTEGLAIGICLVMRRYTMDPIRVSGITEGILHGHEASGYMFERLRRVRAYLSERFTHFGATYVDFGPDGLGVEHETHDEGYAVVQNTLSLMSPWGVPCFSLALPEGGGQMFTDIFKEALERDKLDEAAVTGRGSAWYRDMPNDQYIDEDGRRVMYRAHALLCPRCFEHLASDYEHNELASQSRHFMSLAQGDRLRFPRFSVPHPPGEEVVR
jgi:hypothetical protein